MVCIPSYIKIYSGVLGTVVEFWPFLLLWLLAYMPRVLSHISLAVLSVSPSAMLLHCVRKIELIIKLSTLHSFLPPKNVTKFHCSHRKWGAKYKRGRKSAFFEQYLDYHKNWNTIRIIFTKNRGPPVAGVRKTCKLKNVQFLKKLFFIAYIRPRINDYSHQTVITLQPGRSQHCS